MGSDVVGSSVGFVDVGLLVGAVVGLTVVGVMTGESELSVGVLVDGKYVGVNVGSSVTVVDGDTDGALEFVGS